MKIEVEVKWWVRSKINGENITEGNIYPVIYDDRNNKRIIIDDDKEFASYYICFFDIAKTREELEPKVDKKPEPIEFTDKYCVMEIWRKWDTNTIKELVGVINDLEAAVNKINDKLYEEKE